MLSLKNILALKESRFSKWLFVTGLLIAVVWGWKSLYQTSSGVTPKIKETPDLFFSKFKSTIMNESGQIHYELAAAMLYHYSDDNRATLELPVITLFDNGEKVWQVRANSGTVINDGEQFVLQGAVNLLRQTDGFSVKTEALTIWPDQLMAKTDLAVTLTSSFSEVKAIGMLADFSKKQLIFISQARGRYEQVY